MKTLRRCHVLAPAVALLTLLGPEVAVAAPAAPGVVPESGAMPLASAAKRGTPKVLRIATYNTASTLRTRRAVSDVRRLARSGVHVLALQEMASPLRRKRVRRLLVDCAGCAFRAHMPRRAVPGSTPILYRTPRFRLRRAGVTQVTKPTFVGARGAGPSTVRAKYVTWVRLRDTATGRALTILNNHAVPSVQGRGGRPRAGARKRLSVYRKHMRGLQHLVTRFTRKGDKVFVTGDLNVNFRTDRRTQPPVFPYRSLGAVGLRASYDLLGEPPRGTHVLHSGNASRLIDYVYLLPRPAVRPVRQRIRSGYHSDHRPLEVRFRVTPRS